MKSITKATRLSRVALHEIGGYQHKGRGKKTALAPSYAVDFGRKAHKNPVFTKVRAQRRDWALHPGTGKDSGRSSTRKALKTGAQPRRRKKLSAGLRPIIMHSHFLTVVAVVVATRQQAQALTQFRQEAKRLKKRARLDKAITSTTGAGAALDQSLSTTPGPGVGANPLGGRTELIVALRRLGKSYAEIKAMGIDIS